MAEQDRTTERRRQVLAAIQNSENPLGVAAIAAQVGIHLNTARFHLANLEADAMIERLPGGISGPGRPPVVYQARPGQALGEVRRYRMLAEILLSHLSASGDASSAAEAAGSVWGAHLVDRPAPYHQVDKDEAVTRLTSLLAELDFAPEVVASIVADEQHETHEFIRLRHCPFLELADHHRNLVCAMHLGLMQGALAELRAPVTVTRLEPFAEPAACLAHLAVSPA